jgi:diguanylate cyclase (GGDEF)-like protein
LLKAISYREQLLHQITNRIRQSLHLTEILNTAVAEIRAFLDIDRVKVYRFEPDGCGQVIAEAIKADHLPPLLHLRFPAGDIPPHAREMFIKARQRVIVDVAAQRQVRQQLDSWETGKDLTMSNIRLAPADPCHVQYLTAMGVLASLIVPILHGRKLWGLLAVHHASVRHFSEPELQMVQLLVDQVSIAIAQSELLSQARQQAHHEATINQVSQLLHCPLPLAQMRQGVLAAAIAALQGSGGRLYITPEPIGEPAQFYTLGIQPTRSLIEETLGWQKLLRLHQPIAASSDAADDLIEWQHYGRSLLNHAPDLKSTGMPQVYTLADLQKRPRWRALAQAFDGTPIRSIVLMPLQFHNQLVGCLTIFRNGYDTEILWAGRCNPDVRQTMPRESFAAWREVKVNQAPLWTIAELKLLQSIGLHLYMATTQKRVEAMIRYQACHDSLTQLPNRLLFNEQLSLALINAQQHEELVGVAFLDLDRFKVINDTLGHAVGDQLLQQVAERLQSCLRSCDVIARWGGDEFTLLLPHLGSVADINKIAQRILDQLATPFQLETHELYITASLGVALAPYDGEDAQMLMKNADSAMYQVKQQGKNGYQLYHQSINQTALEQLILEGDLRKALQRDEFVLYYQPQIDLLTQQTIGLEALIRWNHPRLGFISPGQFIPLAEETGLICAIGDWVLQTACKQHQHWRSMGLPPIRIAINLSAQQFQQPELVQTIVQTLASTGVPPEYLELEITESAAMRDVGFTTELLQQLQQVGVQIAMDDFGTGYSSLSAIKHFPFHVLKVDQSFVRDAIASPSDAAIVKAVVALGKGLGLKVLAEGVETEAQLEFLRAIDCDSAQGYLFSKPVPAEQIAVLLAKISC